MLVTRYRAVSRKLFFTGQGCLLNPVTSGVFAQSFLTLRSWRYCSDHALKSLERVYRYRVYGFTLGKLVALSIFIFRPAIHDSFPGKR